MLTADYDFWVHPDDVARFNAAVAAVGLVPNHTPEEVRRRGRYVVENDEHVDVLATRSIPTVDGVAVASTISGIGARPCASIPTHRSPFRPWLT